MGSRAERERAYLARVAEYTPRILAAERASRRTLSPDERARALAWYRIERADLEGLAYDLRLETGRPLSADTVLASAATLSPATSWHALKVDLPGFILGALDGDPVPPFATYGAQRLKAARIVREGLGVGAATGLKVSAFARALAGDPSAVVIDRHAARIGTGDDTLVGVPASILGPLQAAYAVAAGMVGVDPAALQALVWVARVGFGGVRP